jgi:two-component system NtrC family sensor kinase
MQDDCTDIDEDHCRMLRLFQDLSLNLNDTVYVHDLNGTLLYLNERGIAATKYTAQDLLDGLSIYDLVVPEFTDIIEARLESPGAVSRAPYTSEIYTKDGDRILLEITSRVMMRNGRIGGIIGVARDLRLARRLENEIARINACMDALLQGLPSGVLFADASVIILDANPAAVNLIGAPNAATLVGMPLARVCNEEKPVLGGVLANAMKQRRPARLRYSGVSSFGAEIEWDLVAVPVRPPEGKDIFLIILCDLSSNKTAEHALIQSEKLIALGEIVGGIAHELNNPLTGIIGYTQLLLNSQLEPTTRGRIEHVASEAERCHKLVQNLFTFAHRDFSQKLPQNVNEIAANVLALREYQFHVDGIDVHAIFAPGLPDVMANAADLQRVFLALLMNAQQALNSAGKKDKRLSIKTYVRDQSVCIDFDDNGLGIPKCIQSKVFDPFFSTKGVGGGSGLGLSVAYGLIRSHGGAIAIESHEGQGTKFTVSLPVCEPNATRPSIQV